MKYYIYIVECSDNSLYTGYTNNIEKRLKAHNERKGAKYTKSRTPVILKYTETLNTKSDAMKREYAIKKLTHKQKIDLINQGQEKGC